MRRVMKAKKDIAGIQFIVSMGELVNCTPQGKFYSISPIGKEGLTMCGIPAHYLVESHVGLDS